MRTSCAACFALVLALAGCVGVPRAGTASAKDAPALLLGPLAVDPTRRGEGIGRMLVARTLDQAMLSGHRLVILVADPGYYEQFGFVPAAAFGFSMPNEKPERLWIRPLAPGQRMLLDARRPG